MTEAVSDPRHRAPAVERNREPILDVLRDRLPVRGTVLELGSGTGEHALYMAHHLSPHLVWQPSEADPAMLASIAAWRQQPGFRYDPPPNLRPPLTIDLGRPEWPRSAMDSARFPVAVVAINVVHIAPWKVAESLFAGAAELLMPGRILYLYGPFKNGDAHVSRSNAAFDADLRRRNPEWGIRSIEELRDLAAACRFDLKETIAMPVNNHSLVFRSR